MSVFELWVPLRHSPVCPKDRAMRLEGQLLAKEDCARRATDAISQLDSLLSLPYVLNPLWTNGRGLGKYPSALWLPL